MPRKGWTSVGLRGSLVTQIDECAEKAGMTRPELVETAVQVYINENSKLFEKLERLRMLRRQT